MKPFAQRDFSWTVAVDQLGIFASVACFVHCLAMPVVLSLLAVYAHFLPSEEHTHRVLAAVITLLGAVTICTGYRRHRRGSVLVFMAAGVAMVCGGAFAGDRLPAHWIEVLITLAGSCCLIVAHRKNHTFCQSCSRCP